MSRRALTLVLAASAGFVVVVGYISYNSVETGAMSGNTIATGAHIAHQGTAATFIRLYPIPAFVAGVASGVALVEMLARRSRIPPLALITTLEAALLVVFMFAGRTSTNAVVILPAFALGLQTAALRRIEGRTVRTTFITGMLTRFAEDGVTFLFDRHDARRGYERSIRAHYADVRRLVFLAGIWSCYLAGAIVGAFLESRWHLWSVAVPIVALLVVAGSDSLSVRTIAHREERREARTPAEIQVRHPG